MTTDVAYTLLLVRHGETECVSRNRFCGWSDVDLTPTGILEATRGGKKMAELGMKFDVAYTSVLRRAIKTLFYIQNETNLHWVPVIRDWRLNERMFGALTGLNRAETVIKHGVEQVNIWRHSWDVRPPPVEVASEYFCHHDPKYQNVPQKLIPRGESLKDASARILPYFNSVILPDIKKGRKVIIVVHENVLRILIKYFDNLSEADLEGIKIPTGMPFVYEFSKKFKPVNHYFVQSDVELDAALDKMAVSLTKTK